MKDTTKLFLVGFSLGIVFTLAVYGYMMFMDYQAVNIFSLKDDCHNTLRSTCDTANSIIDLTYKQGAMIEKCYNQTLPKLTKLDCEGLP